MLAGSKCAGSSATAALRRRNHMNEMIAFALCGLIAFHLGLLLQKLIRPQERKATGFPFGVTAAALGAGMFFHAFEFLSDYIALLFLAFLAVFLIWRLCASRLESVLEPQPYSAGAQRAAPARRAGGRRR